jgi:plastocyanin
MSAATEKPMITRGLQTLVVAASLAALGASLPVEAQNAPRELVVVMDSMNFGRLPTDAKVGDVIVWDNRDTVQHTATARDGSFDVRLQPGQKGRTTLRKAGNLAILCTYHPMMRATLKVAAR